MGEFWTAIAAGVLVSAWNKFVMNGRWHQELCSRPEPEEEECVSSQSSAISLDVHTH